MFKKQIFIFIGLGDKKGSDYQTYGVTYDLWSGILRKDPNHVPGTGARRNSASSQSNRGNQGSRRSTSNSGRRGNRICSTKYCNLI